MHRRDRLTILIWAISMLAFVVATVLLWGAGLFHLGGKWPSLDELDHIGSFLSGVFTPIALAWAARSFLLQRQQMETTFDAMERQLHLQGEANEHTRRQMEAESEERGRAQLIDDARTAPRIRISSGSELIGTPDVDQHLGRLNMNVFNSGEDAMRVRIWIRVHHRVTGKLLADITELREEPLAKDNRWRLTVNVPGPRVPPHDIRARISAFAERVDGRYAEWHFDLDESFQSRLDFASVVSTAAAF